MTEFPSAGVSLKPVHFAEARLATAEGLWFEVHPENYMDIGGPRLAGLESVAERHPLSLHGVGLSLGGPERPDAAHLSRFRALIERLNPARQSEHLAWSRFQGHSVPDLLPIVRTSAVLQQIADNIDAAQCALGRTLLIENPSHYLPVNGHDWSETAFLRELVVRTGCGLLVDVHNVYVSARNLAETDQVFEPFTYLADLPHAAIGEVHLAGGAEDVEAGLRIDSHDAPVPDPVWALYQALLDFTGPVSTLIEWDDQLPEFADLMAVRDQAQACLLTAAATPQKALVL